MRTLDYLPEEHQPDTLDLMKRVAKMARETRVDIDYIIQNLEEMENNIKKYPNYYVIK